MTSNRRPPVVLVFAASDPTCGAGLQADSLTVAALGAHPMTVVTGLTAQDSRGVQRFEALNPSWIHDQAEAVLADCTVAAFKIGVLGSPEIAAVVGQIVARYAHIPLVADPVMASGRGDSLAQQGLLAAYKTHILPHTHLLTPNLPEAWALTRRRRRDFAAATLAELGCQHVLITGTHETTPQVANTLFTGSTLIDTQYYERLPGSYHGSGCTLASACAAALANGASMADAVRTAQDYTWQTLKHGWQLGQGQAIPDRLFWLRAE